MKPTFRKSMIWLHTYTGLIGGWLLFAIFLTGTLSYYNAEFTHWMTKSELNTQSQKKLVEQGLDALNQKGADAQRWYMGLPDERGSTYYLSYQKGRSRESFTLDSQGSQVEQSAETRGGDFFRTFHYTILLRDWGGRYYTGVAAMLMLIGVFTGIYTHRRFFKDFFTLRLDRKRQFLTDFHAVSGIVTIPFCFVICLSALFIYINLYQPLTVSSYFDSYRDLDRQVSTGYPDSKPTGQRIANGVDIEKVWQQLPQYWGEDFTVSSVSIKHPLDKGAQIVVSRVKQDNLSNKSESLAFDYLGNKLADMEDEDTARSIRRIFYGLHEAHFASPALRAMLFILGLLSTLLISTGSIIWLEKRQSKVEKSVYLWVNKLNHACFYGLLFAIAAYLLVTKSGTSVSAESVEIEVFLYSWLFCLTLCLLLSVEGIKLMLLKLNLLAYLTLFLLDIVGPNANLFSALSVINVPHLTISLIMLLTCTWLAHGVYRGHRKLQA